MWNTSLPSIPRCWLGDDEPSCRLPSWCEVVDQIPGFAQCASARDVSEAIFPAAQFANEDGEVLYDIKHLSASFDGERFLFSAHQPVAGMRETALTWNIWEFDLTIYRQTSDLLGFDCSGGR